MVICRFAPKLRSNDERGSKSSVSCDRPKALPLRTNVPITVQRMVGPTFSCVPTASPCLKSASSRSAPITQASLPRSSSRGVRKRPRLSCQPPVSR